MKINLIKFLSETAISSSFLIVPLFAKEIGASNFEIGLIGTFYGLATFLSFYIFGRLSDIYGRKKFLILGLLASAISFLLQAFSKTPFQLLLFRFLAGFCSAIFSSALIAQVYDFNKKIGKFSAFGSLGWATGYLLAGILAVYWKIFFLAGFFFFLAFVLALKLKIPKISLSVPFFPIKLIKNNISIFLPFFLRHFGAQMVWTIFPLYLSFLGISKLWIGIIYFTNTFCQFLIMPNLDRFEGKNLINLGLLFSAVTFFLYTLVSNQFQFLPIQILLAFSWSSLYVGCLKLILEKNVERASATGLFNSITSLALILGPLTGGILSQHFGYVFCLFGAVILTLIGFFLFLSQKN